MLVKLPNNFEFSFHTDNHFLTRDDPPIRQIPAPFRQILLSIAANTCYLSVYTHFGCSFSISSLPNQTDMNIAVYAYIEQLTKIGEVNILYDRIINIDFKIPVTPPKPKTNRKLVVKEQPVLIRSFRIYYKETPYPYAIKRLSRADLPYRTHKLTHQLQSSGLCETNQSDLYIRLTTRQCLQIHYYNKEFIWQSTDFKKKIFDSIIGYLIPILMGAAGAVMVLAPWKHAPLNDLKNNHLIPIRKPQPNEKNKEDSVSKNHNE